MAMTLHDPSPGATDTYERAASVSGLKLVGTRREFLFDAYRINGRLDGPLIIGRAHGCHLRIKDGAISRQHCVIEETSRNTYLLLDHSSTNRVYVRVPWRDIRYRRVSWTVLHPGMRIRLGDTKLIVLGSDARPVIAAATFSRFMRTALHVYGSKRAAARGLRIPRRLFSRLLDPDAYESRP